MLRMILNMGHHEALLARGQDCLGAVCDLCHVLEPRRLVGLRKLASPSMLKNPAWPGVHAREGLTGSGEVAQTAFEDERVREPRPHQHSEAIF